MTSQQSKLLTTTSIHPSDSLTYQPVCQRCSNPLQLDQDFEHLQKAELIALLEATNSDEETPDPINLVPIRNSTKPHPRYIVPPNSSVSIPLDGEDSVDILQSYSGPSSSLDHRLKVNAYLFDVLSGRTEVDHPLCKECADTLLAAKEQCLKFQEEELECLRAYLNYLDPTTAKLEAKLKSQIQLSTPSKTKLSMMDSQESYRTQLLEQGVIYDENDEGDNDIVKDDKDMNNSSLMNSTQSFPASDYNPLHNNDQSRSATDSEVNRDSDNIDVTDLYNEDDYSNEDDDDDEDENYGYDDDDNNDPDECNINQESEMYSTNSHQNSIRHKKKFPSIKELEQKLQTLQTDLNELIDQSNKLDKQIAQDTIELEKRTEELDRATTQYNDQKQDLLESEEQVLCLESRLNYAKSHLQRLQRTNLLNIAFPIWYDGHIGLINGLHLGRLSNRPVGWEEINAAWGQCALLLQCIGRKLNYAFQNYLIVPMGSQSKVFQLSPRKEFPLYYTTGGMRLLSAGNFDTAMINFLDCLNQVQQIVENLSKVQLPYRIKEKGKLQDQDGQVCSIRWYGNSEENWTKALKMMLINMKWIIGSLSLPCFKNLNKSSSQTTSKTT